MIQWTPDLSTGETLLDEQHRAIFEWLAELESAAADERTLFGVYAITRLKNFIAEHFAAEEALMKSVGYPDLVEHMAEHARFRAKIVDLQLKCIGQEITTEAVEFLSDWLSNHIAKTDMAYVPYLDKQVR